MGCKSLNGADYLLLLLYIGKEKPVFGAIRLTKMMFLFNEEISKILKDKGLDSSKLPNFVAYNFGPFSKDVYEQVELFKGLKFIKVTNIKAREEMAEVDDWEEQPFIDETSAQDADYLNQDGKYYKYEIDSLGRHYVEEKILKYLNSEQLNLLESFKEKIVNLKPKQILKYVYQNYPQYTENSLIKHEVLGK